MIYPQNFEQKTGFDKVRRLISEKCLSPLGEERVAEMGFSADYQTVTQRLEQTDEFVRILHGEDEFPASYFFDVRYSLKRIRPEGTWLDEKELFDLKRSLQTINDIIRFFRPSPEEGEEIKYPALTALAGDILVFPQLIGKIDAILGERQCLSFTGADTKRDHGYHERYLPQLAVDITRRPIGRRGR